MKKYIHDIVKKNKLLTHFYVLLKYKKSTSSNLVDKLYPRYQNNYSLNGRNISAIKRDVLYSLIQFNIRPDEYFRYGFYDLNESGRHQYVGERELDLRYIDDPNVVKLLNDKYNCYKHFRKYYNRDVVLIKSIDDINLIKDFCENHKEFIVKPINSHGGAGIWKCKASDYKTIEDILYKILDNGEAVIEELILQSEEMAIFHPASINTIRIVTCNYNGKVEIVQSSVRLGTGGSIVDNGCLSASVDIETGIISSLGRSAHEDKLCMFHPDTHVQILGHQIPKWDDLKKFALQLPLEIPNQRVVGWDIAYGTKGFIMIEGNAHPSIQILSGNGVGARELFEKLVKQ